MQQARRVHIPRASAAWKLIMQSGVGLSATVGLSLSAFLASELELTEKERGFIDVLLIDGMPVDDPALAVIEEGSRLALAAGLPGIAGLAMKRNSAVRALRGGITHRSRTEAEPGPGRVTLALYSLVLPALGGHFLRKGIFVAPSQFKRYARFAPGDICQVDGQSLTALDFAQELPSAEEPELFLTAIAAEDA